MKTASSRPESLFVSRMRLVSVGILALTLPGISDFAAARELSNYAADMREDLGDRSEEHTSELQSRENLVCRLLLEKKKKTHKDVKHVKIQLLSAMVDNKA